MDGARGTDLLLGVIEGFYGKPWTQAERFQLFDLMAGRGLNTYMYAPKDDLTHRAFWRGDAGPETPLNDLRELIARCNALNLRFIYALSPGLDIRYNDRSELEAIQRRFTALREIGCNSFALLFDDIPDALDPAVKDRFGSLASAQAFVANSIHAWLRDPKGRLLFCPTPYCGRMAERKLGGEAYLETIGRELAPEIDIFWTGPEIISEHIPSDHIESLAKLLRRKPLIWDNLHANDYDGRRFYAGPYAGRAPALRDQVAGFLTNPNNEWPLNFIPLVTLASYALSPSPLSPRETYSAAVSEWLAAFRTHGRQFSAADLTLFLDCFYLPHSEGDTATELLQAARRMMDQPPSAWGADYLMFTERAAQLKSICARLTELEDRSLLHALSRKIWDLREELDLFLHYFNWRLKNPEAESTFRSDFHLPGTYRGGFVSKLQRLLQQHESGAFTPSH